MKLTLRRPALDDEAAFGRACRDTQSPHREFVPFYGDDITFAEWLAHLDAVRNGIRPCAAGVPFTLMWGVADGEIVGSLSLRHALTEKLRRIGGHIGFYTRPAFRRRGVARAMLTQALVIASEMGLGRILLTCDEGNIGSRRTIEGCGGVLEDIGEVAEHPERVMRYWIDGDRKPLG